MTVERQISLYAVASLLVALLVLASAPGSVGAASIYQQLDASTLGETGAEHPQAVNPVQKLGNGLTGAIGSVAYKISGANVAADIAIGWGEVILVECAPGGSYTSCNNRASSNYTHRVISDFGNSAIILVDMTVGGTVPPYPLNPDAFYFLFWGTSQDGDPTETNDLALFGSATNTYPGGVAQWINGTLFEPDAHIVDIAFNICDTAVCDLPSATAPDIDPPVLGITIAATALTRPTVTGTTNDPAAVSVLLNSKFYTTTPSGNFWSVPLPEEDALFEGVYLVAASSTDAAGNSGITSGTFYVDLTAPAVAINNGPADDGYASSTLIAMAFEVADLHIESAGCSFDDMATSTCTTTASALLPDGGHKFAVEAKDHVGNSSYKSRRFTVDTAAPTVSVDNRTTNELAPVLTGNSDDTLSGVRAVKVLVNGQTYEAVVSGTTWSATLPSGSLGEGSYQVLATAEDKAGNTSQAAAGTLIIDRTAPTLAITSGFLNGTYTNMTAATFTFTSDTATLCSIDGGDLTPCVGSYTASGLSSGTHLFTVSATDEASNTTTRTRSWNIDTAAPILAEVAIALTTSDTTPEYVFSSSKAGTTVYGGACSSLTTVALQGDNIIVFNELTYGTYNNCTITVTDTAGNMSSPLQVSTFTITPITQPHNRPTDKDQCKLGGWRNSNFSPAFKNQGDCVSYVVSHKGGKDDN